MHPYGHARSKVASSCCCTRATAEVDASDSEHTAEIFRTIFEEGLLSQMSLYADVGLGLHNAEVKHPILPCWRVTQSNRILYQTVAGYSIIFKHDMLDDAPASVAESIQYGAHRQHMCSMHGAATGLLQAATDSKQQVTRCASVIGCRNLSDSV
jgi:hypothetical protein